MIDPSEYHQRLARLQARITDSALDALVIGAVPNVRYLTGVHCESEDRRILLVVPGRGEPTLIVPRMEQEKMAAAITVKNFAIYWEKDAKPGRGWEDKLQESLGDAHRIGLDPYGYLEILTVLADRKIEISELVEDLRVIKSPAEIAITRRAAQYWTQSMNTMLGIAKAGVTVSELMHAGGRITADVFANEPRATRSDTYANQFFQTSPGSSSPHYVSRAEEKLPHGPCILNAIGSVCGYNAENERTILSGDYSAQHAELFDIAHQAHLKALSLIKPGVPCADVDSAIQAFFHDQGLGEHLRHRVGHGFGLVYHERPYTSEGSREVYQAGMLISVEPGLYVEGVGGFRHSDTVLVTEQGIDNFTTGTPIDRAGLTV